MTSNARPPIPPIVGIIVGLAAVSSSSILIKFAQRDAPSLVVAAARLVLASIILTPLALTRYRAAYRALTRGDWWLTIASGVFLALHFATWVSSLEFTTVASSIVLVSSSPLFVAMASTLLLGERIGRSVIVGLVLALAGGVIVALSDTANASNTARNPQLGDGLALAGAVTVAGYLIIGRRLRAKLAVVPYIALVYGTAAVTLVLVVAATRQSFIGYSNITYLWLLLLALGPQLLGHSSYNWALAHLPATFVSVATLGEPIGSTLLAYFILGETPTLITIIGAIFILVGIVVASHSTE